MGVNQPEGTAMEHCEKTVSTALRDDLIRALSGICRLEAFSVLEDLLQGESLVLQYLSAHRGEEVFPSVLSSVCRLSRPRITGTLKSLQQKGQVQLEPSDRDRRMVRVSITEEGMRRIGGQVEKLADQFDRMIAGLGEEDARRLVELVDRGVAVVSE